MQNEVDEQIVIEDEVAMEEVQQQKDLKIDSENKPLSGFEQEEAKKKRDTKGTLNFLWKY